MKPNQVDYPRTVREMGRQPPLPPFAYRLEAENLSFQLDIRHIAIYFVNVIDAAPVNIFIRKIINQIVQRVDFQLLVQYCGLLRPYTGDKFDVACG